MKDGLTRLRFALAYPDWLLLFSAALLLIVLAGQLLALPRADDAIEQAERQLARQERDHRRLQIERRLARTSPEEARQNLLERFPDEAQLHRELGRLIELAKETNLRLPSGDYRLIAGQDKLFDRYVLNLPVQGGYRDIRRYLGAARQEFPTLAIEDVTMSRENIGTTELNAQLRLVIFSRRPASP